MLAATVLIVAANLRAAITSVGPVLPLIATDTDVSAAALGALGSVPLLAFALVSPLVHLIARRLGTERAVLLALLVLASATVLRSLPGWSGTLWLGTALIGASIAVCNVLVPAIVKRDFPASIPVVTGAYSAILSGFAALASGFALPLAHLGGWRLAIGAWGALSVVAALFWLPRVLRSRCPAQTSRQDRPTPGSMWRSATAWQVALFMGSQSTTFYLLITWLPSIEQSTGIAPLTAGWHLFVFQLVGVIAGPTVTVFMRGRADQRLVGVVSSSLMIVSMVGLLLVPGLVILWIVIAGLSSGSAIVIALTLVAQRARSGRDAGRLSGMVQSIGYLLAVLGPLGAGVLFDLTGAWSAAIIAVAGVALVQLAASLFAGRDRYTHPELLDAPESAGAPTAG